MDKIDVSNLHNHFGLVNQDIVHAGERYTNVHVQFEEEGLASGHINTLVTPTISLTQFALQSAGNLQLLDYGGQEEAGSAFVLHGTMESHFYENNKRVSFDGGKHNLQYNARFVADHYIRTPRFEAFSMSFNPAYLQELLQYNESAPLVALNQSLGQKKNYLASAESLPYAAAIAETIHAIRNCPFQGATRFMYIEGRLLELFALQTAQLESFIGKTSAQQKWSATDIDKLHGIRSFIETNYLDSHTLQELTRRFSLNEFKLKKGYKQFFNETVFGTIYRLRMQKAKELLLENAMNVTEVAYFIGYENLSSFSAEFKKRFGYNPGNKLGR
ncbi:MAG TPA: AraC family transcriptional regulator [Phnomibacter sp.]|nr:AraC family transcriptional regulator [Phnomibacter sp.]